MAQPPGAENIEFKCIVEKLYKGNDYDFSYTAEKNTRLIAFKRQVKNEYQIPGVLTLWHGGKVILNEREKIGNVLQPKDDILHICFDEEVDIVEGGYAEGAVVKGFGGRVFAEGGFAEGGSRDANGNVTTGSAFGGRGKGAEGRGGKAFGGNFQGFLDGIATLGDGIAGDLELTGEKRPKKGGGREKDKQSNDNGNGDDHGSPQE